LTTSPQPASDGVRKTTCYMCACRCGIDVHVASGRVTYIEGNRDHPINKGVLCAKGASGIMQITAPSRLRAPLRRVGPRGSGAFEEISWDEALSLAVSWMKPLRETAPEKLAFFTGRDQSQSLTGWWAQAFGTPNYAAHGGFCSVNMAAAGIYTMGGAFWEFGQPDWTYTKLFILFGVAEDHDSNPIKMGIGKLKARGARIVGVNPIRSGYNAVADDWLGITPGTEGLLILSLVHVLVSAGKIDLDYLSRYTNAPVLVNGDPKSPEFGLFLRDAAVQSNDTTVEGFDQPMKVSGMAWGPLEPLNWTGKSRLVDFFDVKADVERLLAPAQAEFVAAEHPALHPGRSAQVLLNGRVIGHVGELHPRWRQAWDLPHAPVVFELDLDAVTQRSVPVAQPVAKLQAVERDIAVIVREQVTHAELMQAIHSAPTQGLLRHAVLFDVYRPKIDAAGGLAQGEKSLAVRLSLHSDEATLTDAQIEAAMGAVMASLSERVSARLRS
jgi:anaerobic selenocysteine-containing dehydrogenase